MNLRKTLPVAIEAREVGLVTLLFFVLVLAFLAAPWYDPDDWETFQGAAGRILSGESLYGSVITHAYYSNPPWLALALVPLAVLPFKLGWAVLAAASLFGGLLLLRRWQRGAMGVVKPVLVLLSPAMFYTLLHGQIDTVIIAGALLPAQWWPLVAVTKPQVAAGLIFGVPLQRWKLALLLTAGVVLVSILLFGLWPLDLLRQPTPFVGAHHNLWLGLWPFQVPAGVALIALGMQRKDERLLIAGSPFLAPYAATSTLLGPWIALVTFLNSWQALAVWLSWWGAVFYRAAG